MSDSYQIRKAHERMRRIARARENLAGRRVSLAPPAEGVRQSRTHVALSLSLSVATVCHMGVAYAAYTSHADVKPTAPPMRVQVKLVAPPAPPEVPPEAKPQPVDEPAQVKPAVTKRARDVAPAVTPRPAVTPAPVAIVGLTLESTTSGGSGPAFAVGSTLSGSTERIASTPHPPPETTPTPPMPAATRNRRAEPRAAAGVRVEPARRLSRIQPEYPPLLERQGIEADVTVRVTLAASGRVERVELVRSALEPAFDRAAIAAAEREQFAPETHDGEPVGTTLTYTYRFRIAP